MSSLNAWGLIETEPYADCGALDVKAPNPDYRDPLRVISLSLGDHKALHRGGEGEPDAPS